MTSSPFASIIEHFSDLDDPRAAHRIEYQLEDIVIITLCAVLCGADNWVEVSNYGRSKAQWLKQWIALPNGIPSHDTFEWVFARLKPQQLQQCFLNWTQANTVRISIKQDKLLAIPTSNSIYLCF